MYIGLLLSANRPFPSSPGPLFQNEGRCSAFDMEIIIHSHANKTIYTRKVVHLTSFWKWGFLDLGSGLFSILPTSGAVHFVCFFLINNPIELFLPRWLKLSYALRFILFLDIFAFFLFGMNIIASTVICIMCFRCWPLYKASKCRLRQRHDA